MKPWVVCSSRPQGEFTDDSLRPNSDSSAAQGAIPKARSCALVGGFIVPGNIRPFQFSSGVVNACLRHARSMLGLYYWQATVVS